MDRDLGAAAAAAAAGTGTASAHGHGVDDSRSRKGRLMGKLFGGRERKTSDELRDNDDDNVKAFLHGPTAVSSGVGSGSNASLRASDVTGRPSFDTLPVAHPGPPRLAKLDTRFVSRYPNAHTVAGPAVPAHAAPAPGFVATRPPRPGARGFVVRFADTYPDIIGEGGDESDVPTIEISKRRRRAEAASRSPVLPQQNLGGAPSSRALPVRSPMPPVQAQQHRPPPPPGGNDDDFVPGPIRRTQTGFSSISDEPVSPVAFKPAVSVSPERRRVPPPPPRIPAGDQSAPTSFLGAPVLARDENRRSFIEIHQAEMRQAEGLALANALRADVSPPSSPELETPVSPILSRSPGKTATPPSSAPAPVPALPPPVPPPRHPRHKIAPRHQNPESSPILPPPTAAFSFPFEGVPARGARPRQVAQAHSPVSSTPSPAMAAAPFPASNNSRENVRSSPNPPHLDQSETVSPVSPVSPASAVSPASPETKTAAPVYDAVPPSATDDDALTTFVARSRHLFALFRLQAESLQPLSSSSIADFARAALWWFTIGRMALENAARERAAAQSQGLGLGPGELPVSRSNEMAMQQAYADLAKAYWLMCEVLPERLPVGGAVPVDVGNGSPVEAQVAQVHSAVLYNLRKLARSMQRNDLLPPEDAFLPQTIDKSIWVQYPPISADITALLWGYWGSSLTAAASLSTPPMTLLRSIPLSDSPQDFVFSRMWADAYLMEQGRDSAPHMSPRFHFPCMLSVARPQSSATLEIILASQNGTVQLRVQGRSGAGKGGAAGPTWESVRWRSSKSALEILLPRGFLLVVELAKPDYGLLWSMYDFGAKVHSQLYPRQDERPVFRTTLKAFQYFEKGPPTGSFPKEAVPECDVALFEKTLHEGAATGPRSYHRGCRLAVVSGTRTRTLYGVSQAYLPADGPLQFSYLRGENGAPALLLYFENSRSRGRMVLTFATGDERVELHTLLAGTSLYRDERVVASVPLSGMDVRVAHLVPNSSGGNQALAAFRQLGCQRLRVINYDDEAEDSRAPTVLAEKLRVVYEVGSSTVVDRINVAPGELRIRLDVRDSTSLIIWRQPQQDLTVAVSEAQVMRETTGGLAEGLRVVRKAPTCRTLRFATVADLHAVQAAVTGFRVLFDGMATMFLIARRRMVVPIHKKWEAGATRIQVVAHPDSKVVQLLAFFHDFAYGQCMGFVLKGTDVYEAFGRGNRAGIKFDDAKFPLPRLAGSSGSGSGSSGSSETAGGGRADKESGDKDLGGSSGGVRASIDASRRAAAAGDYTEAAFVCLDMPDLPGEHDDISIVFDNEGDRDRLASCLPSPVRESRLAKMF